MAEIFLIIFPNNVTYANQFKKKNGEVADCRPHARGASHQIFKQEGCDLPASYERFPHRSRRAEARDWSGAQRTENFATEHYQRLCARLPLVRMPPRPHGLEPHRRPAAPGRHRHPPMLVREQIIDIFRRLAFTVAEGPEIEDDWHVFESLNFAADHPARDMQDTFFIGRNPRCAPAHTHLVGTDTRDDFAEAAYPHHLPGRVYRNEAISARAHCFFHQVEALYVDRNVTFADPPPDAVVLRPRDVRPRHTHTPSSELLPFTEPSAEMDISCDLCGGKGCSFCKGYRLGGNPRLRHGRPRRARSMRHRLQRIYRFALGMGIERITNLKYRVKDLQTLLGERCALPRRIYCGPLIPRPIRCCDESRRPL